MATKSGDHTKTHDANADERGRTIAEFKDAVNMSASRLERWLDTDESKAVGQKNDGDGESTGHVMGREIVRILRKKQGDYTDDDLAKMRKVTGYVHRHLAQRPDGDVTETPWRYSLMNWGRDPS